MGVVNITDSTGFVWHKYGFREMAAELAQEYSMQALVLSVWPVWRPCMQTRVSRLRLVLACVRDCGEKLCQYEVVVSSGCLGV